MKLFDLFKKIPLWGWVFIILILLILSNMGSSYFYKKNLWNLFMDQIRTDQSKIIKTLEENMQYYEKEIMRLQQELENNLKQQAKIRAENETLKEKINELQNQRQVISVPSDADGIVDELHRLGIGSAHRRR